ncbi:hypothetical protein RI367_005105 [Sorochytrium milnesiophthora]
MPTSERMPRYFNTAHDPSVYPTGPFVQFRGTDLSANDANGCNRYSILIVHPPSLAFTPVIKVNVKTEIAPPTLLDDSFGYQFWRFDVAIPVTNKEQIVKYSVGNLPEKWFRVPGADQCWRWAFFTCNGFSPDVDAVRRERYAQVEPLWSDIMNENQQHKLHLLIGMLAFFFFGRAGDQLYFDQVWDIPALAAWARIEDKIQRKNASFTKQMAEDVEKFYLEFYMQGFFQNTFTDALSHIPYCMSWDDHDIFDGWGSYPAYLHDSFVFRGILSVALRFYLLFQLHTNAKLARQEGHFGLGGYHRLLMAGRKLAIMLPDTRTERSLDTIVPNDIWVEWWSKLRGLPPTVEHLLFIAPLPLAYPAATMDGAITAAATVAKAVNKFLHIAGHAIEYDPHLSDSDLYKEAVNIWAEPELLDDLRDEWVSSNHLAEKALVLSNLQQIAQEKRMRVTIMSGDVHLAACGLLYTSTGETRANNVTNSYTLDFLRTTMEKDHRLMFQIISTAIGNLPPPGIVATSLLNRTREVLVDEHTSERMLDIFQTGVNDEKQSNKFYLRRRNWSLGEQLPDGSLRVAICVERVKGALTGETKRYSQHKPLSLQNTTRHMLKLLQITGVTLGAAAGGAFGFYLMERAKVQEQERRLNMYLDGKPAAASSPSPSSSVGRGSS